MERLTKRTETGVAYMADPITLQSSLADRGKVSRMIDRLAAYEDTGMTPEELRRIFPVPIGTKVYVVETCRCGMGYAERCQAGAVKNAEKRKKAIEVKCLGKNRRCMNCAKLFERPFGLNHLDKVGKSVFLSRKDAEKAMGRAADG